MNNVKNYLFISIFIISVLLAKTNSAQTNSETDGLFTLAQNYEQAGQFEKAEKIYTDLLQQQNQNYSFFDALNRVFIKQKKYSESISLLQNRIKNNPQDVNSYGLLGSTYFMMDELQNAFDAWEKGIITNPANVVSYRIIANYAVENRAYEKAIDILKRGKGHSNDPFVFAFDLANIYSANMRFEDAAEEYCNLLLSRPDQIGTVKSRIASYLPRQGSVDPTIKIISKYAADNPIPSILDLLAFVYISTEKFDEAFPIAIDYDKKTLSKGNYVFVLAQDAYRNKKYETAANAYNFVIENYPNSQLLPISKIGFANTLAESVASKFSKESESWKPFSKKTVVHRDEYSGVIKAYNQLAKEFPGNAIYPQAIYKMAKIYSDRLYEYQIADSLFKIINQSPSKSEYSLLSFMERGKIAIIKNKLDDARIFFQNALSLQINFPNENAESKFYLAQLEFWNGYFSQSLKLFKEVTRDLSTDFSNNALEISSLINICKRDSLNLYKYAQADLYSFQNMFKEAANEFKTLADNPNLFILKEFANLKYSEMLIAIDDLPTAVKILEILSDDTKTAIFADKALFLTAQVFRFGINDVQKAIQIYQKLLEKFPNSLYFERARDCLKDLKTNNG